MQQRQKRLSEKQNAWVMYVPDKEMVQEDKSGRSAEDRSHTELMIHGKLIAVGAIGCSPKFFISIFWNKNFRSSQLAK